MAYTLLTLAAETSIKPLNLLQWSTEFQIRFYVHKLQVL